MLDALHSAATRPAPSAPLPPALPAPATAPSQPRSDSSALSEEATSETDEGNTGIGGILSGLGSMSPQSGVQVQPGDWQNVDQTGIGDCYFVSSMVDVAKNDPQAINNLIKSNSNGTYTVSFHGQNPITVDGQGLSNGIPSSSPKWSQILEQAWEQSKGNVTTTTNPDGSVTHTAKDNGGYPADALRALTGDDVSSDSTQTGGLFDTGLFSSTKTNLDPSEINAVNSGQDVVAQSHGGSSSQTWEKTAPGQSTSNEVAYDHAYSVIKVDPNGDVVLRNPWGNNNGDYSQDGDITLTQQQFGQEFSDVEYT